MASTSTSRRRAGVVLGYVNIAVKNVVNLLYTPMLLAYVGRGDYGVFQTSNSFVFSLSLLSFGFSGAYVRFYSQRKADGDEPGIRKLNGMYLMLYLAICSIVMVAGLVCSANVGLVFSEKFTPDEVGLAGTLMVIMTVNVATTLLSTVFDACVIVHEEFTFQQTRQMLTSIATPGIAIMLLSLGLGAVGVAVAQLAVNLALLVLNIRFAMFRLGMRFDMRRPDCALFMSLTAFSAWLFANQVCEMVNQNVPNVVLGAACGASVVAVFAVSLQVRNVFYSLSTIMSNVFVPLVNRVVAETDDNKALTDIMARVGRYQSMLYLWVYGGFVVCGRWFVSWWAGRAFEDSYWLVLAMTAPLYIPLVQNVGIEIQKAKNLHRARSLAYLCFAAVNLLITWYLSPTLGYWAPVIGYDVYVVVGTGIFMNWYYHSRVGLNMLRFWGRVLPTIGVSVVAGGFSLVGTAVFPIVNIAMFLLWGTLYTAIYAAMLYAVAFSVEERETLRLRLASRVARKEGGEGSL